MWIRKRTASTGATALRYRRREREQKNGQKHDKSPPNSRAENTKAHKTKGWVEAGQGHNRRFTASKAKNTTDNPPAGKPKNTKAYKGRTQD